MTKRRKPMPKHKRNDWVRYHDAKYQIASCVWVRKFGHWTYQLRGLYGSYTDGDFSESSAL